MDLRHLRYFLHVAEELHFGRAAQRLGMSQPPLSQQIRALEEELGARLFERTSRRVRLTEAGRRFLPEARQALAQAERAVQVARLAHRGELGRLALGFTASAPFVARVADALYRYRQSHPQVELALQELGRDAQIARIERGELDMGIIRTFEPPLLPAGMAFECLVQEEMLLAVRQDHPLARCEADPAIADLAGVPLVLYNAANGAGFNEHFFALCEQAGFRPSVALEASSFATLLGLVAAGFGPTVLAQSLARLQMDNLVLRSLSVPVMSRLWMIHKHELSPTAQAFRDTMAASGERL
ncbi:LysR substrate-binding domain-containing protein [Novosphingobium album (ex Liu et al. 2023)]|uniref:LysR substrate-binding domain-containing protein n=1 Tax=Novosphingobium album (ex Liu et al. 2023) TaxID=3031130 RepID=A0ABT5WT52_9SPHN|nr:LysR substrate-binding domain-containing protein [Novosphingobium album (ex Liu et al. 2023)]MDE8653129.1 LysR substrate-binding domain-containing protein [Novosphingobium album (ex Liu et al. 2023)]